MPVLKGTMGYQRFTASGEVISPEQVLEKLKLFQFRPLHERGEDKETLGWSSYLSEYDHEKKLEIKDFLYGEKIILSLRYDIINLPKEYLKARIKKSLIEYERDHNKKPDRTVKKEIEAAEAQALRARVLPKTRIVEAVWCQKAQELKIFSRSSALIDRFTELFQETFLIRPSMRDFAHEAYWHAQSSQNSTTLELLSHEPIFMPPLCVDIQ
jgi:DNA recombination-dependent growth factor C